MNLMRKILNMIYIQGMVDIQTPTTNCWYNQMEKNTYSYDKYPEIYSTSNEWSLIEYKLQLCTGTTTTVVKRIFNLANPNLISQFDKANKGALQIDSFMQLETLEEINNRLDKVTQKGFEFPKQGIKFVVGFLKPNAQAGKSQKILMFKVAVGKSYCMPSKSYSKEKVQKPDGFDSIYLYNEAENTEYFRHEYILFRPDQVLPCYLVEIEYDTSKELALKPPNCEICGATSKWYCVTEDIHLCPEDDLDHHKGKIAQKHERKDINDKPKAYGNCSTHTNVKLELFCTVCNLPLCVSCKISGDHETGEMGNHQIVRIADAYDKSMSTSKELDPALEKRKQQLTELLGSIDIQIKEVNKRASQIEEEIYQLLQNALRDLRDLTQKKMSYLIGDQLELKRQYDQIQWMESFLKYQHQHLMPSDFLSNWSRHLKLRKEVLNLANIPVITDVKADIRTEGKIVVISDSMNVGVMGRSFQPGNLSVNIDSQKEASDFRKQLFNKNLLDKNSILVQNSIMGGPQTDEQPTAVKSSNNRLNMGIIK